MHYNCLIVDDEEALCESTAEYFNLFGVSTVSVFSADRCSAFLKENTVDLILLDINLGRSSGFELCKRLREKTQIPILFISARCSDDDVLLALHIGGDDYIQKPYSLNILLAKVKAVLKRCAQDTGGTVSAGGLRIDRKAGKVYLDGEGIKLKAQEYRLLDYLVSNRGRVLSKEELFRNVWGEGITSDGTLNVHIRHLREKIEKNPNDPACIRTVWGVGYIFEESER